jgi:hypothetical protein
MYCGFTVWCPAGGCPEVHLSPIEGWRKHRPSLVTLAQDAASRTAAVLLGRVFYRDDLLARLPDGPDLREALDAALALAAYRHLGRQGLE